MLLHTHRSTGLLLAALLLAAGRVSAETVTITLDEVSESNCDTVWMESGCPLWFTETTSADLTPGFCLVVADANNFGREGVYLWPGRLALDLSAIHGLETVEVDIYETHLAGSTRARLYRDESQVYYAPSLQEDAQTLVLENLGQNANWLAISAHEAYVWEIRLIGQNLVGNATTSLGLIKALYR